MNETLDKIKQLKGAKKTLPWLVKLVKPYIVRIVLVTLIGMLASFLSVKMAEVSKLVIDNAGFGQPIVRFLVVYVVLMIAMLITTNVTGVITMLLKEKLTFGVRKDVYDSVIHSHWMKISGYHNGDLMTRLTGDVQIVSEGLTSVLPSLINLIFDVLLVFFTLFSYSPFIAFFALLVAPVAALVSVWFGHKMRKIHKKVQESEAVYRSFMQESIGNLLIVKAFANEDRFTDNLKGLRSNTFFWIFKRAKYSMVASGLMSLSFQVGYIAAFAYGALQISKGEITYGTMSVFLALVNRIQSPIVQIASQIPAVVAVFASSERVMEISDIEKEEKCAHTITDFNAIGVRTENLTFSYDGENNVLNNLTLDIKPGSFTAVMGESGIGKTTLVRLMMSFMDDFKGNITYYNEKGEEERVHAGVREFISYVPQGNTLFSGTVKDNILMGRFDAGDDEIIEALKAASAYDFVMDLPDKENTVIGERGLGLSEGQAQRIAIARALVRRAPVVILDEATSALDEQTEMNVMESLAKLDPKPACIIITHRKSILKYCDAQINI